MLVVEEDLRTAASLELYLRHAGYHVAMAASGPDALSRAGASPPDLAIALASKGSVTVELPATGGQS